MGSLDIDLKRLLGFRVANTSREMIGIKAGDTKPGPRDETPREEPLLQPENPGLIFPLPQI